MSMASALSAYMASTLGVVHTAMPAKIVSYDSKTHLAEVVPTVRMAMDNGVELELPKLKRVPVIFPSTKAFDIEFPVAPDDEVLLIFSEADLSAWIESKGTDVVSPGTPSRFGLNSAIAIPGLRPTRKEGSARMAVDEKGTMTITAPKIVLNGQVVVEKDMLVRDDVYVGPKPSGPGVSLKNHVHPTAVGPTSPATPAPIPPEVQ